jgi:unsaturated rhamnogalacturonyl hydrolase
MKKGKPGFPESSEQAKKAWMAMLCCARQPWEQGMASRAALELGDDEAVYLLARDAALRQLPDGRLAMLGKADVVTDPASNGEALIRAWEISGEPELGEAAERQLAYLLETAPRAEDGTYFHFEGISEIWVDSMAMAPPFLSLMGHHEEALLQVEGMARRLMSPEAGLFSHRWDEEGGTFARKAFWGIGNGWALDGMLRIDLLLPPRFAREKAKLLARLEGLIDSAARLRRASGLFPEILDDPGSPEESQFAAMLAYVLYKGIEGKVFDRKRKMLADSLRDAVREMVDEHGFLREAGGSPGFESPGTSTEGQAFYIMMEAVSRRVERWSGIG